MFKYWVKNSLPENSEAGSHGDSACLCAWVFGTLRGVSSNGGSASKEISAEVGSNGLFESPTE